MIPYIGRTRDQRTPRLGTLGEKRRRLMDKKQWAVSTGSYIFLKQQTKLEAMVINIKERKVLGCRWQ